MFLMIVSLLISCGEEPTEPIPPSSNSQNTQIQSPVEDNVPKQKVVKPYNPLEGKSIKEICSSTGLSLIKWSFKDRQGKQDELCCGAGGLPAEECMMDWPSSGVMNCSDYDVMRNEIYARYGRTFKKKKWQKYFGATDWYVVRKDFSDSWISPTASKNAKLLLKMKKDKVSCMGE